MKARLVSGRRLLCLKTSLVSLVLCRRIIVVPVAATATLSCSNNVDAVSHLARRAWRKLNNLLTGLDILLTRRCLSQCTSPWARGFIGLEMNTFPVARICDLNVCQCLDKSDSSQTARKHAGAVFEKHFGSENCS